MSDYSTRRIELVDWDKDITTLVHGVDPCRAMNVARAYWREFDNLKQIRVVNERTEVVCDTITREKEELANELEARHGK